MDENKEKKIKDMTLEEFEEYIFEQLRERQEFHQKVNVAYYSGGITEVMKINNEPTH